MKNFHEKIIVKPAKRLLAELIKKPRKHPEHDEQVKFFRWVRFQQRCCAPMKLIYAVPNSNTSFGDIKKIMWMKAEGLESGVPDINMDYPSGHYHGLRIENKVKGNKLSPDQERWREMLIRNGYKVVTCYSFEEAKQAVIDYLKLSNSWL